MQVEAAVVSLDTLPCLQVGNLDIGRLDDTLARLLDLVSRSVIYRGDRH